MAAGKGLFRPMTISRQDLEWAMDSGKVYLHPDEMEPLCRYAKDATLLIVIGVAYGASDCLLLMSTGPKAKVHGIDPFVPDSQGGWQSSAKQARRHVAAAAERLGFDASRWILHEQYSYEAVVDAPARVDYLFLDGDHRYEAVRRDFEDWLPKVKVGGVVLIHDSRRVPGTPDKEFNQGWPGPTQLAEELRQDARVALVEEAHSLTIWRKPPG